MSYKCLKDSKTKQYIVPTNEWLNPLSELITLIKINIISYSFLLGINWIYQIYNVYKNFENSGYDMYIYIG